MNVLKLCKMILPLLLLTGCWSRVEINEQLFVFALYVDQGDQPDTVEITISSPLPTRSISGKGGGGGQGKPYAMINKTGSSIPDTINAIQRDTTRQLDFSHTRAIVVGREYAETGIRDILDWIMREPSLNLSTFILAAAGKAKEITKLAPVYEQMPSFVLMRFEILSNILATTAKDCLIGELGGQGFALTYLNSHLKPMISEQEQLEHWVGIEGAALFRGDQMKGAIQQVESKALAWAMSQIRKPIYTVTWDEGRSKASVIFINPKATKEAYMTSSGPLFKVKLSGMGDMILLKDAKKRSPLEVNRIIINELEELIRNDLNNALQTTQKLGTDVMQFGNILEAKYPNSWDKLRPNWGEHYRDIAEFDVKVNVMVRTSESSAL